MVLSAVSGHGELPALIPLLLCRIRVEIKLIHLYTTINVKTSGVERAPQTPRRRGQGRGVRRGEFPPPFPSGFPSSNGRRYFEGAGFNIRGPDEVGSL